MQPFYFITQLLYGCERGVLWIVIAFIQVVSFKSKSVLNQSLDEDYTKKNNRKTVNKILHIDRIHSTWKHINRIYQINSNYVHVNKGYLNKNGLQHKQEQHNVMTIFWLFKKNNQLYFKISINCQCIKPLTRNSERLY